MNADYGERILAHYDLADLDRKTLNSLARKESASHTRNQDVSQQITTQRTDNLGRKPTREMGDVSRRRKPH